MQLMLVIFICNSGQEYLNDSSGAACAFSETLFQSFGAMIII